MVYVLAGCSSSVAVDFILGRGWRNSRAGKGFQAPSASQVEVLTREVEEAFLQAPSSGLVALQLDPTKHFEMQDLICAHKYVMEHRLFQWIGNQNHEHGVAPSREQIRAQALAFIPAETPEEVRTKLSKYVTGSPRKVRRWLARFRARWGARIGILRPGEDVPLPLRKQKAVAKCLKSRGVLDFSFLPVVFFVLFFGTIFGSAN